MNYNKTQTAGRITRDIELRYTPKGTAVADISLAVNRKYKDGDEPKEDVTFIDVTLWGRSAEIVNQYSGKGQQLFVEGRLQTDSWEDKTTGQKRSKLKVVADNVQLIGFKDDKPTQKQAEPQRSEPQRQAAPAQEDDIPF